MPLPVTDALIHRVGPHPGAPFSDRCLHLQSRAPGKGALCVVEEVQLQAKPVQRGLLIASCKRSEKDTDRSVTPGWRYSMAWHTAPPGSPHAKQLSHLQAQLLLGPRCHSQHTYIYISCVCASGSLPSCPSLCWPVAYVLLCQGSPGRNTGEYWPVLLAAPF